MLPVGSKVLPYVPKVAYCKAVVTGSRRQSERPGRSSFGTGMLLGVMEIELVHSQQVGEREKQDAKTLKKKLVFIPSSAQAAANIMRERIACNVYRDRL